MLFNSYIFIFLFLPISLLGWYGLNRIKKYQTAQIFLIAMSLWFYAYFNSYYLAVILGSCAINYFFSFILAKKPALHRVVLLAGCIVNLGILGVFKYYDFCVENLNAVFHAGFTGKNILLPLGISFFTFQQLSFVIDRYLSFVTFFPQLIAGPIVLHTEIIPQFQNVDRRKFEVNDFAYGICYFVFGLSKKVLLADTLAGVVNYGFSEIAKLDTPAAAMVAVSFALELYFDFSGYCDMDVWVSLFGKLQLSLYLHINHRILAALAYFAVHLVSGLCLHSAWRQQKRYIQDRFQHHDCFSFERAVAWRGLELCPVGLSARAGGFCKRDMEAVCPRAEKGNGTGEKRLFKTAAPLCLF